GVVLAVGALGLGGGVDGGFARVADLVGERGLATAAALLVGDGGAGHVRHPPTAWTRAGAGRRSPATAPAWARAYRAAPRWCCGGSSAPDRRRRGAGRTP